MKMMAIRKYNRNGNQVVPILTTHSLKADEAVRSNIIPTKKAALMRMKPSRYHFFCGSAIENAATPLIHK
jgi:hypothetical protein